MVDSSFCLKRIPRLLESSTKIRSRKRNKRRKKKKRAIVHLTGDLSIRTKKLGTRINRRKRRMSSFSQTTHMLIMLEVTFE